MCSREFEYRWRARRRRAALIGYKKHPNLMTRETAYHIFIFPARRARAVCPRAPPSDLKQINSAILKVSDDVDGALLLNMDSCRGTVPMKPPKSHSSIHHRELSK
jgi:hypothetical protein